MFNILLGLVNLLLFVTLRYLLININKELDRYHEEVNESIEKLSKRIDFLYENLDPNIEIVYQMKNVENFDNRKSIK